jgi:hypothetical protein
MKQRPILFNGAMVRAILSGQKTQTRRVMKVQPLLNGHFWQVYGAGWSDNVTSVPAMPGHSLARNCPFGQPGDQLWVREAWMPDAPRDGTWADVEFYGCKDAPLSLIPEHYRTPEHCLFSATWTGTPMVGWTPSIHMPRWASRITLEITGVRVERLKDISEEDARSEGIEIEPGTAHWKNYDLTPGNWRYWESPIQSFRTLWESINGAGSWEANPWVWVLEFKRVEQ